MSSLSIQGLIKIRLDPCWKDLTCMNYHYQVNVHIYFITSFIIFLPISRCISLSLLLLYLSDFYPISLSLLFVCCLFFLLLLSPSSSFTFSSPRRSRYPTQ